MGAHRAGVRTRTTTDQGCSGWQRHGLPV